MDVQKFFVEFQDFLAPKLDTYEQAIYLYVFRHSRLLGLEQVTIEREKGDALKIEDIAEHVAGIYPKVMTEGDMEAGASLLQL